MRPVLGAVDPPLIHIATANIRRPVPRLLTRAADRWERRGPALARRLERERPTVLGAQEVFPGPAEMMLAALGSSYARVGEGRQRGRRGEGCPVFYDRDRLELLESRQLALSDAPEVAGSMSWGNPMPRVMVVATFRERFDGRRFSVVNTHLDPFSPRSRVRSSEAIRAAVRAAGAPAVVLGDMNAAAGSTALRALQRGDLLVDAWGAAAERVTPAWGTFAGYRAPTRGGARIDWILTTPDITVERIAIDGRPEDGIAPSDHLPLHAAIEVPR